MALSSFVVAKSVKKVLIFVSALFCLLESSLTAQKLPLFHYVAIDTVVMKKTKPQDKLFPFAVSPQGKFVQYSTAARSFKFEGNDTHVVSQFSDSMFKNYFPPIQEFSFVNDSIVFIVYDNNYFIYNEDAIVLYNLKSRKTNKLFNLSGTGLVNRVDLPYELYPEIDTRLYNQPWGVYPFKNYNSVNQSYTFVFTGSTVPFDGIFPLEKPSILNINLKPDKSKMANFTFSELNTDYKGYQFDTKMDNLFYYVPKLSRIDDSLILVSYPLNHDLIEYNTNSNTHKIIKFKKEYFGIKENSMAKPNGSLIFDSLHYQFITYNSKQHWITRRIYAPVANFDSGSLVIKNNNIDILTDKNGNPLAIQSLPEKHTGITYTCENGIYYGTLENTDTSYIMGRFKIEILDSLTELKIQNYLEPNYVNIPSIIGRKRTTDTISVLTYNFGCGVCTKNLRNFYKSEINYKKNKPYIVLVRDKVDSLELINAIPKKRRKGLHIIAVNNELIKNKIPTSNGFFIKSGKNYNFEKNHDYKSLFYHVNSKFNYKEFCMIIN